MPEDQEARERIKSRIIEILVAAQGRFKGGRTNKRDRWYGVERKKDFHIFKEWWHRKGKRDLLGRDFESRKEAEDAYETWESMEKPNLRKLSADGDRP